MTDHSAEPKTDWQPGTVRVVPVEHLFLDNTNPRLPEEVRGQGQEEQLRYLYEHGVLEELGESLLNNGYFAQEPLLVVSEESRWIVVEGNRRLAALKILLQDDDAQSADLDFLTLDRANGDTDRLLAVPCYLLRDRREVFQYLGYRHIGGAKMWPPEAKARYLADEIQRTLDEGIDPEDAFRVVGKRVGSNSQGVRNPFMALRLLGQARESNVASPDRIAQLQSARFGVWLRAMNAADLKLYIGIGSPSNLLDVRNALAHADMDRLGEVILDLTVESGARRALLADSRDVTMYSKALTNDRARKVLRETGDLQAAADIVNRLSLRERILSTRDRVSALVDEIAVDEVAEDLVEPAEGLYRSAQNLRALVRGRTEQD